MALGTTLYTGNISDLTGSILDHTSSVLDNIGSVLECDYTKLVPSAIQIHSYLPISAYPSTPPGVFGTFSSFDISKSNNTVHLQ